MSERGERMSTVAFFVMVGVLAVYGLCEGIVRFFAWIWIPKEMKAVTLVRCEDEQTLTPLTVQLWEEREGHPVMFWTEEEETQKTEKIEKNGRISLSNVAEILLFLSK